MRILCVDDDRLVLAVTSDLLRDLGHEVIEAVAPTDAIRILDTIDSIDMLVTDIHMPGNLDGLGLAQYAKAARPGLPVIYFSGLSHVVPPNIEGTVLRKPCTLGELDLAVEAAAALMPGVAAPLLQPERRVGLDRRAL